MSAPLFTVIVPCFDCAATLAIAVRSVLDQTCGDFELLLVDDGSRDTTLALCHALAAGDGRIRVLSQANAGVAAARNRGAREARGELIAFLDADDWWAETKLAAHGDLHARQDGLAASFARIQFVPEEDKRESARTESTVPAQRLGVLDVLGENCVCTMSNVVVARTCFESSGGFRLGMSFAEDQEWLARLIAAGADVRGIDELLVFYRTSAGGLSSQLEHMYAGWRSFAYDYAAPHEVRKSEAAYCRYLARRALRLSGPAQTAIGYTLRGLRLDARSFFADPRRGLATTVAAFVALLLPLTFRQKIFA